MTLSLCSLKTGVKVQSKAAKIVTVGDPSILRTSRTIGVIGKFESGQENGKRSDSEHAQTNLCC